MAPPPLRIPVALDLNSLRDQAKQASDRVGETLKGIGRGFKQLNGEMLDIAKAHAGAIGFEFAQHISATVRRLVLLGTAASIAFELISAAINQSRQDLQDMLEIADKARNALVSPAFYQGFVEQSKQLRVGADELKGALDNAFGALKEQFSDTWQQGDKTKEKLTEVVKVMQGLNIEFSSGGAGFRGVEIFRNAQDQEARIRGAVTAMAELNASGNRLVALDLAEKLFGGQLADRIRQGRLSFEQIEKSVDVAAARSDGVFPTALVTRAKELDDQLKIAQQRLENDLKPSYQAIAGIILNVRATWVGIVNLMAEAVELLGKLRAGGGASVAGVPAILTDQVTQLQNRLRDQGLTPQQRAGFEAQLRDMQARIAQIELKAGVLDVVATDPGQSTDGVPLPRARPANAPAPQQPKAETASGNRFDSAGDAIERRTAALEAETAAIDLGTAARARARIVAELETVAKQVNAAAGKTNTEVTQEQRDRINELADAYAKAAAAAEKARSPLNTFARESADVGKQLNQAFANSLDRFTDDLVDVISGTKKLSDAFRSMANEIIKDLLRIAIRKAITGPIAGLLGSAFGFSEGGQVARRAAGGAVSGPGTGTSDSILAAVSDGEYIVNAEATARHRDLLDAINFGGLRGFADGGPVASLPRLSNSDLKVRPATAPAARGGGGEMRVYAPVTIIAPSPEAFHASRGQVGRSIGQAVRSAGRFQ